MNRLKCLLALVSIVPCVRGEQATEEEWSLRNRLRQEVRDTEQRRNALVDRIRIRKETAETLSTAASLVSGELKAPPVPKAEAVVQIAAYETDEPCVIVGNGRHNCRHRMVDVSEGGWYRCSASVRASDVSEAKGLKFGAMLTRPDGTRDWPSARLGAGTFDWVDVSFEFTVPAGCRKAMVLYGFEGGEGRVEFRNVRIEGRGEANRTFVIRASEDWVPATPCTEMQPGSALDFSSFGFADGPCGKFGRIVAKGESFEFERRPGVPVRFMGVNFCYEGNVLPKEESRRLVRNLVRLGYNAIRVHHHDNCIIRSGGSYTELDPEAMDRFDAMMAACRENGVYVTTDLFVSRKMSWRAVGIDRDGMCSDFKTLLHFHDGVKSNYLAFARNFLSHRNPYTGLRYAEDPTLAWLSLVNEGALWNCDIAPFRRNAEFVLPKWKAWLRARRTKDPAYDRVPETLPGAVLRIPKDNRVVAFAEKVESNDDTFSPTAHVVAFQQFLVSLHWDFYREMRQIIRRELGSGVLLTDNNGWMPVPSDKLLRDRYDFVDEHFYYGHPEFLGPKWSLPARIFRRSGVNIGKQGEFGVPYKAGARLFNHPFSVSEYNYAPPLPSRAAAAFLLGATAALQNWSSVWRFCWTCSAKGAIDSAKASFNHFDMAGDPCAMATEKAISCLYLRRDLPELKGMYPQLCQPSRLRALGPPPEDASCRHPFWMAYRAKIGRLVAETKPPCEKAPEDPGDEAGTVDGSVCVNRREGWIRVDTPRTTGGFVERPGVILTSQLTADVSAANTSVWASSLDRKPIADSRRILFTLVSDVQNPGIEYEDEKMEVLVRWGRQDAGRLARRAVAKTMLKVAPGNWKAYALNPDGSRKREIDVQYVRGSLNFVADIAGDPKEAEFYYELVRTQR